MKQFILGIISGALLLGSTVLFAGTDHNSMTMSIVTGEGDTWTVDVPQDSPIVTMEVFCDARRPFVDGFVAGVGQPQPILAWTRYGKRP